MNEQAGGQRQRKKEIRALDGGQGNDGAGHGLKSYFVAWPTMLAKMTSSSLAISSKAGTL